MTAQERGVRCLRVGSIVFYNMRTRYDLNVGFPGLKAVLPTR